MNRETGKIDCFADDATCILKLCLQNLKNLKATLKNFETLSGLSCNLEKTTLMTTGTDEIFDTGDLGFQVTEKFTLLGFVIDKNLESLNNTHKKTLQKMVGIANHWHRYNLSLPGRILIAKTFLYSQMGYSCSILLPSTEDIKKFKNIILNFVNNRSPIARDRVNLQP